MRIHRNLLVLCGLVLGLVGARFGVALAGPESTGPRIDFAAIEYDFGQASHGEVIHHAFAFKNTGDRTLDILRVQTSCGCTATTPDRRRLEPGESGSLTVSFDSRKKSPTREAQHYINHVLVFSNDPRTPQVRLVLSGTVISRFHLVPQGGLIFRQVHVLGSPAPADPATVEVMAASDVASVEGIRLVSAPPGLRVEGPTPFERDGERGVRLSVFLTDALTAPGPIRGHVVLETGDARHPRVSIPVFGSVVPSVRPSVARVYLPRTRPEARLTLLGAGGAGGAGGAEGEAAEPLRVLRVEAIAEGGAPAIVEAVPHGDAPARGRTAPYTIRLRGVADEASSAPAGAAPAGAAPAGAASAGAGPAGAGPTGAASAGTGIPVGVAAPASTTAAAASAAAAAAPSAGGDQEGVLRFFVADRWTPVVEVPYRVIDQAAATARLKAAQAAGIAMSPPAIELRTAALGDDQTGRVTVSGLQGGVEPTDVEVVGSDLLGVEVEPLAGGRAARFAVTLRAERPGPVTGALRFRPRPDAPLLEVPVRGGVESACEIQPAGIYLDADATGGQVLLRRRDGDPLDAARVRIHVPQGAPLQARATATAGGEVVIAVERTARAAHAADGAEPLFAHLEVDPGVEGEPALSVVVFGP